MKSPLFVCLRVYLSVYVSIWRTVTTKAYLQNYYLANLLFSNQRNFLNYIDLFFQSQLHLVTEKNRNNDRISKLEDQMKNLSIAQNR